MKPALAFTPEPLFNIAQPLLEDYLHEVVIKTGKLRFGENCNGQSTIDLLML